MMDRLMRKIMSERGYVMRKGVKRFISGLVRNCAKINLQFIQYVVSLIYGYHKHGKTNRNNVASAE